MTLLDIVDESPETLYALAEEQGWGDGLPLVAPTEARVADALEAAGGDPDEILAVLEAGRSEAERHQRDRQIEAWRGAVPVEGAA